MSQPESSKQDNIQIWAGYWDKEETEWHLSGLNPALVKFGEQFFGSPSNNNEEETQKTSILFPLCGKSLDMTLLAPKYDVAGIEGVKMALEEYAKDSKSVLVKEEQDDIAPYEKFSVKIMNTNSQKDDNDQGKDVKDAPNVDLYFGDFFALDTSNSSLPHRTFDRVFDRGSFVAIEPALRREYVKVIGFLMKPGAKWMISSMQYDPTPTYSGAPYSLGATDVNSLLEQLNKETGEKYVMEVWEVVDALEADLPSYFLQKNGGPFPTFNDHVMVITKGLRD